MLLTTVREEIYHLSRRPSNLNQCLCDRAKSATSTQTDGLWPDIDSGLPELSLNQEMKTKGRGTIKCTWTRREGQSGQFQGLWYQPCRDRERMMEERPHFQHRARAISQAWLSLLPRSWFHLTAVLASPLGDSRRKYHPPARYSVRIIY